VSAGRVFSSPALEEVNRLWRDGRTREALVEAEALTSSDPDNYDAWTLLGFIHLSVGRAADSIASFSRAVELRPGFAQAHMNLAQALLTDGRRDEAVDRMTTAASLAPDDPVVQRNRGAALHSVGRLGDAIDCFTAAVVVRPDFADAHGALAMALQAQGDLPAALRSYRRAVELEPKSFFNQHNFAIALREAGDFTQAVASFQRALAIKPRSPKAHYNLGVTYRSQGKLQDAIACFRLAISLQPDYPLALGALVRCTASVAEWATLIDDENRLRECVRRGAQVSPHVLLGFCDDPAEQLQCARSFTAAAASGITPLPVQRLSGADRIRIAYLSSDFHEHATAYLMAEVFELHDRYAFEVIGVSYGPDDGSEMRARLVAGFDTFFEARHHSDSDVARELRRRGVHIAVDLKGPTDSARVKILAYRPAPIQVSYLGYPGTSGATFLDYIIADGFVIPGADQRHYSEHVVYMPFCYQANDRRRAISTAVPSRADEGLPAQGFVFCCFNATWKISPAQFARWMRLLGQLPNSVLWLIEGNPWVAENLRREAARRGVDPARLVFARWLPPHQHLARQRLADLFLDTFPCGAHTTTSDALWGGLPLLTYPGRGFASRVAGSLLQAARVPELIATSPEHYDYLALSLARDPHALAALRSKLASASKYAPIFDSPRFCRSLEAAYRAMWGRYASGLPCRAFSIDESLNASPV
jgi:protein O-GlcNAc transferase